MEQYFNNRTLSGTPAATRYDRTIDFDWDDGRPIAGVNTNRFSVRWTGQIVPAYSETYTFSTMSDDGVRLWVNGQLLVDNWTDHGWTVDSGTIALVAGPRYDIKMEYYERAGGSTAELYWESASQPQLPVPAAP